VLTADIRHAIWEAAQEAVAVGDLPVMVSSLTLVDPSTLRPASNKVPGSYASTLPYLLSTPVIPPIRVATILAERLASLSWIASTTVTAGHLNITVTADALASLAVRIPAAPDCAASDILRGLTVPAPHPAGLDWADAQSWAVADAICRLGRKAGAQTFPERLSQRKAVTNPAFTVATASGYAGPGTLRYALLTRPRGWRPASAADLPVRYHSANPVYAVRYAHAHAASTLRQAVDLGLDRGEAVEFVSRLLGHPIERALLDAMSWLPERVAWAARRGRPGEFARYLEALAGTYHDCRERCPALPFGGHSAPRDPDTTRARLWLVTAVRTTIAAGVELLGVSAPDRL
jgi:arginyl-tRNA synthetase